MPLFKRFVEIGRVALVNFGDDTGKLCVIVNVIDANRVLVDGPASVTGVQRQQMPLKRLALTNFTVSIPLNASHKVVAKAFKAADVAGKFAASAWGQKLASKAKRAALSDFDRFKVMVLKKKRSAIVNAAVKKIKA